MNKRVKTLVSSLLISLSLLTVGGYKEVKASSYPMSIEQAEFDKYKAMTLEELQKVAKSMPESNLNIGVDEFGEHKRVKLISPLYKDENIYFIKNELFGEEYLNFYKFIYVKPWLDDADAVEYHAVRWDFTNNKLEKVVDISSTEGNKEFHDKLVAEIKKDDSLSGSDNDISNTKKYTKKRIFGLTRIDTSKAIAEEFQTEKVDNVIITSGLNFPDALSGSVLAKKLNAPILLVGTTPVESTATINYVKEHLSKDGTVYILGGQGAVNESFIASFKTLGFNNIKRLWGNGRYDTNKAINNEINVEEGTSVVLASGEGFADALSISSIASIKGYPIVLTSKDKLTNQAKETLEKINPGKVYVVGGNGSISDNVKKEVKSITNLADGNIVRLWGADRYKTSLNIAKYFNLEGETVTFASGKNFPDALAGSILSTKYNAPLILIGDEVSEQKKYIDNTKYTKQIFFGGEGSISKKAEEYLAK